MPTSLRAAIADWIELMSEATQQIVRLAALLGQEFSVAELPTLFGRPAPELADAMMEAYRANVLVDSGERTAFRHPLIGPTAAMPPIPPCMRLSSPALSPGRT